MIKTFYSTCLAPFDVAKRAVQTPKPGCFVNRFELFNAMVNRTLIEVGGVRGLINGIELEDGSCHSFNVTLLVGHVTHRVHVKG